MRNETTSTGSKTSKMNIEPQETNCWNSTGGEGSKSKTPDCRTKTAILGTQETSLRCQSPAAPTQGQHQAIHRVLPIQAYPCKLGHHTHAPGADGDRRRLETKPLTQFRPSKNMSHKEAIIKLAIATALLTAAIIVAIIPRHKDDATIQANQSRSSQTSMRTTSAHRRRKHNLTTTLYQDGTRGKSGSWMTSHQSPGNHALVFALCAEQAVTNTSQGNFRKKQASHHTKLALQSISATETATRSQDSSLENH